MYSSHEYDHGGKVGFVKCGPLLSSKLALGQRLCVEPYGVQGTSLSPSRTLSCPLSTSFLRAWLVSQCSLPVVSRLPFQLDATNRLSHSQRFLLCLQLLFPVQEAERP
uniref:Uncharacterized protein n=1 Tax=Opuntia streptacantha TaxID=393608 RepID=A0A7C8YLS9_OPUST